MNANCITPVVLAVVAGCGLLDSSRDTTSLSFSIYEGYFVDPPPPPPHIALIVSTETQYPCMNYRLDGRFRATGRTLRVEVTGFVKTSGVCLTMEGPAQYRTALPVSDGTYTLEFSRLGVTDRYAVTVTSEEIAIMAIDASRFTSPTATRFPREP